MTILGDRIKEYRKVNNLTQKAFSQMLEMGRSTLSQIESGDNKGTIEFIHKLAKVTNKSVSYWIDNTIETDLDMFIGLEGSDKVKNLYKKLLYLKESQRNAIEQMIDAILEDK